MSEHDTLRYPQPHEGVTGIDRAGDPLLTEDGSLIATELMGMLWHAVLVGNPAPIVRTMYERMSHPVPGDAVVVHDSIYRGDADTKHKGTGYLVTCRAEWASTDDEWEQERTEGGIEDADRFIERSAWYIQYGPEPVDICRWTNCMVLSIPRGDLRHADEGVNDNGVIRV